MSGPEAKYMSTLQASLLLISFTGAVDFLQEMQRYFLPQTKG
jgi:hypothetical protein